MQEQVYADPTTCTSVVVVVDTGTWTSHTLAHEQSKEHAHVQIVVTQHTIKRKGKCKAKKKTANI